jgi:chromosome segregation ATPase
MFGSNSDDGGGFGGLAWFQLGRWSAEDSRRDRELLDRIADNWSGRRPVTVDQSYIDHLGQQIMLGNAEIDKADKIIREWKARTAQWENYATRLEQERDERDERRRRDQETIDSLRNAVDNLRYFADNLQRFAEQGLANEPEYEQLANRQQCAWVNFVSLPRFTEINDDVKALVAALESKLPQ